MTEQEMTRAFLVALMAYEELKGLGSIAPEKAEVVVQQAIKKAKARAEQAIQLETQPDKAPKEE